MLDSHEEIPVGEIPVDEIVGERVVLRPLAEPDFAPLYALIDGCRGFLSAHLPWPGECLSASDVASRAESWELQAQMGNGACWGIFDKSTGRVAGCVVVGWVQWTNRSATLSYWLGESFTGEGLATEAVKMVSKKMFSLGVNRLEITASVTNPKSIAVACRAGFVEEGKCREFERINGIFVDHVRLSRLAGDP